MHQTRRKISTLKSKSYTSQIEVKRLYSQVVINLLAFVQLVCYGLIDDVLSHAGRQRDAISFYHIQHIRRCFRCSQICVHRMAGITTITWEVPANWIEFWDAAAADKIKYHMRGSKSHTMFPGSGSSFFANYCSTYGSTIVQNIYGRGNDWFGCQRNEVDHAIRGACWNCCYIMLAASVWIMYSLFQRPREADGLTKSTN